MKTKLLWFPIALATCGLSFFATAGSGTPNGPEFGQQTPGQEERAPDDEYVTTVGPLDLISNDGTYRVRWTHPDGDLEFGERFQMTVDIERTDGEPLAATLAIDSRMPEHSHGMKREPKIIEVEPGKYEVSGMLFHMPGYWEIYFDITNGAVTERAQVPVDLY